MIPATPAFSPPLSASSSTTARRGHQYHHHRKRVSVLRLSSDTIQTTATLPEYHNIAGASASAYNNREQQRRATAGFGREVEEDLPPDYPDSAEEADEDTDLDGEGGHCDGDNEDSRRNTFVYLASRSTGSLLTSPTSSRRSKKIGSHHSHLQQQSPQYYSSRDRFYQHHRSSGSVGSFAPGFTFGGTSDRKRLSRQQSSILTPSRRDFSLPTSSLPPNHHLERDDYLDSLLQRSVQALEISNVLMQSSMSTHSSLSTLLTNGDSPAEASLEASARGISSRIRRPPGWEDDLDEIKRALDGLGDDDDGNNNGERLSRAPSESIGIDRRKTKGDYFTSSIGYGHAAEGSFSSSLPPTSSFSKGSFQQAHHRRPSLDMRKAFTEDTPHLRLSPKEREQLVAPPPRALTQYISNDPDEILLPSTLGLRAGSSSHSWKAHNSNNSSVDLTQQQQSGPSTVFSSPQLPNSPSAYTMLTSFVSPPSSSTSSSPIASPHLLQRASSLTRPFRRRSSNNSKSSMERHNAIAGLTSIADPSSSDLQSNASQIGSSPSTSRSRSRTPKNLTITLPPSSGTTIRTLTPPIEDPSSSSDGGGPAKLTIQSLRKILDEQPPLPPTASKFKPPHAIRSPMPGIPSEPSTSTATASISRLFTKGTHSSSTRAPSPPRQSSLKQGTGTNPHTPLPSPMTGSMPDLTSVVNVGLLLPPSSLSGMSTPSKRISFAELPEPSRPVSATFRAKKDAATAALAAGSKKRKGTKRDKSASSSFNGNATSKWDEDEDEDDVEGRFGWWGKWLFGGAGAGIGGLSGGSIGAVIGERIETERRWGGDRSSPSSSSAVVGGMWGKPGFGSGIDDWGM